MIWNLNSHTLKSLILDICHKISYFNFLVSISAIMFGTLAFDLQLLVHMVDLAPQTS